jgi:hypothetical protein
MPSKVHGVMLLVLWSGRSLTSYPGGLTPDHRPDRHRNLWSRDECPIQKDAAPHHRSRKQLSKPAQPLESLLITSYYEKADFLEDLWTRISGNPGKRWNFDSHLALLKELRSYKK